MRKTPILFIVVAFAGTAWFAGCNRKQAEAPGTQAGKAEKPPLVQVAPARKQAISRTVEVTGDVVATNSVTIRATIDGPIAFCPWREGDKVKKGEKLIEMDRPLYREEVRAAEAALAVAQAKLEDLKAGARPEEIAQAAEAVKQLGECAGFAMSDMKRIEQMVKSGSLPGETIEKARVTYIKCKTQLASAKEKLQMLKAGPTATAIAVQEALVKEAEAKLATMRAKLAECAISALFAGVVTRVHVRPGDLATAKAPLIDLMEAGSLVVRFGVPEASAMAVHEDDKAAVLLDALPGRKFGAIVVRVYPELDPVTRTRIVEAKANADAPLVPGMFARIGLATATVPNAVVVPDSAVLTNPKGDRLLFVIADGKAQIRRVVTGIEVGHLIQIVEGVQPGEFVAVAGHATLKDGAPVRLQKPKAKPAKQAER